MIKYALRLDAREMTEGGGEGERQKERERERRRKTNGRRLWNKLETSSDRGGGHQSNIGDNEDVAGFDLQLMPPLKRK
jgi:hypothetical protein